MKEERLMHSHRNGTFHGRFGLWLFLLGFLAIGCSSTPSATRMEEGMGENAVLESIEAVTTPEKTTVIMNAPGARTDRKTYTLSDPPRICVDLAATPADDLPQSVQLPEGPVEKWLIQSRGHGHTGVVVYVRSEEYKYHFTPEGDKVILSVTPVGKERFQASRTPQPRPGNPSGARIIELAVVERPDGGTRLRIETDRQVESETALEGSLMTVDLKDTAATPSGLKALETRPSAGAISAIRAFYAPQKRPLS